MTITYEQVYEECLHRIITEARYKSVVMKLDISEDMVFINGMDAAKKNEGEGQEMIDLLMEEFKGRRFCSSPPVSPESKHILDKKGIEYKEFMK